MEHLFTPQQALVRENTDTERASTLCCGGVTSFKVYEACDIWSELSHSGRGSGRDRSS
jgi:hypothetical protein